MTVGIYYAIPALQVVLAKAIDHQTMVRFVQSLIELRPYALSFFSYLCMRRIRNVTITINALLPKDLFRMLKKSLNETGTANQNHGSLLIIGYSAINNVLSNSGYAVLGLAFVLIVAIR